MTTRTCLWLSTAALTLLTGYAGAQTSPPTKDAAKPAMHAEHDKEGEHLARRMQRHLQQLKTDLNLSAEQEPAWVALANAMTPPARPPRPDHAELDKLSMPERMDKIKQMMAQQHELHMAEIDKRVAAVKSFYAVLTPEQKKTFDAKAMAKGLYGPHHDKY